MHATIQTCSPMPCQVLLPYQPSGCSSALKYAASPANWAAQGDSYSEFSGIDAAARQALASRT